MKTLLFILVIGNLMLLGLAFAPNPEAPGQIIVPPTPPGVQRLQLLSERSEPESVEPQVTALEQTDTVKVEQPIPEEQPAPVEETETTPEIETVAEVVEPVEEAPPPPPEPVCHTIGPFEKKQTAEVLGKTLQARNAITAMRQSEIQEPAGYWVYLPSMSSDRADEIVESLIANKVKDYFVGAQNYISLGIYSSNETAQERFEQITGLGYNPKLEQRFKVRDVFWLDVEEPEPPFIAEQDWPEILEGNPGVRRQILACE